MKRIDVAVERPYAVTIGIDLAADIAAAVPASATRVAILHAPAVTGFATSIATAIGSAAVMLPLPDGEAAKTYPTIEKCWDFLGQHGFTRSDIIISVGGGATTDLAGFAAATWLRGVGVIHVPTTLLAMVDAAVGGKTGINSPAGKNLVGSFYHPLSVWCDTKLLSTLPSEDLRAGFAEIVKCGFIVDQSILDDVLGQGAALLDPQHPMLESLIARAVQVKAHVVADDFTESKPGGLGREILNYGHTLAHAIELQQKFAVRHGEAVAIGMVFVAELARLTGRLSEAECQQHHKVLEAVGLPTAYSGDFDQLLAAMAIDKKARGSVMRFIILDRIGSPAVLADPAPETLRSAFELLQR